MILQFWCWQIFHHVSRLLLMPPLHPHIPLPLFSANSISLLFHHLTFSHLLSIFFSSSPLLLSLSTSMNLSLSPSERNVKVNNRPDDKCSCRGSEGERDRGRDGTTVGVGGGCLYAFACVWLEDIIMLISDDYLNECSWVDGTAGAFLVGDKKKFCNARHKQLNTHIIMQKHNWNHRKQSVQLKCFASKCNPQLL